MAQKFSLHFGLNYVNPVHYQGWDGLLQACEYDAESMADVARRSGFESVIFRSPDIVADVLKEVLANSAKSLVAGDTLLVTYSGHGGQVPDTNGDERRDKWPGGTPRMDETWCLYDRQVIDDELRECWSLFRRGVRILIFSDSCHSGSVVRFGPPDLNAAMAMVMTEWRPRMMSTRQAAEVYEANRAMYDNIQRVVSPLSQQRVESSIVLLSGCMDNQYSLDGPKNGLFTGTVLRVLEEGFKGSILEFRNEVARRMPPYQTPQYFKVGRTDQAFEETFPLV